MSWFAIEDICGGLDESEPTGMGQFSLASLEPLSDLHHVEALHLEVFLWDELMPSDLSLVYNHRLFWEQ